MIGDGKGNVIMANPLVISITEKTVEKAAENVTSGFIRNRNRMFPLLYTTRLTGEPEPSEEDMLSEGVTLFAKDGVNEEIASEVEIDVYVYSPKLDISLVVILP